MLTQADLAVPSFEEGLQRSCNGWWRLDQAYRRCMVHARTYQQPGLLKPLRDWLEAQYVNNVLLPLTNRWSDQVAALTSWGSSSLPRQQEFHMRYVHAPLSSSTPKPMGPCSAPTAPLLLDSAASEARQREQQTIH